MSGNVRVVFARAFKWSPDGHTVLAFGPGLAEVPPRCAEVAAQAGVLEREKPSSAKSEPRPKAKKGKAES